MVDKDCDYCGGAGEVPDESTVPYGSKNCPKCNKPEIENIQDDHYYQIIEVRVPVRFYWDENASDFDGIEIGPLNKPSDAVTALALRVVQAVGIPRG